MKKRRSMDPLAGADGKTILRGLVHLIRVKFYPETLGEGADEQPFYQDLRLLRQVVTWGAKFLDEKGRGLGGDRYREIVTGLIVDAAAFCQGPEKLRSRPRYLLTCVQKHWRIHADEYLPEGSAFADEFERACAACRVSGEPEPVSVTKVLAAAHDALELQKPARKAKPEKPKEPQLSLF